MLNIAYGHFAAQLSKGLPKASLSGPSLSPKNRTAEKLQAVLRRASNNRSTAIEKGAKEVSVLSHQNASSLIKQAK